LKEVISSASAAGVAIAVARPCNARAISSISALVAEPAVMDDTASSAMPLRNSGRRPKRSAIRPKRRVNPAAGSAYAVAIHGRSARPMPTAAPTWGIATFRMEKSTESMKPVPSNRRTVSHCRPVILAGAPSLKNSLLFLCVMSASSAEWDAR